jgi:hypothetical protein
MSQGCLEAIASLCHCDNILQSTVYPSQPRILLTWVQRHGKRHQRPVKYYRGPLLPQQEPGELDAIETESSGQIIM